MTNSAEHPFAPFVRILGKGKNTSRSLTREEAFEAFTHLLNGNIEPVQLGAFLLLLRVKGETAEELAGFAAAAQQHIAAPPLAVDIDWPSYAGKHKQQPWYLLAAFLLAQQGYRVFMHGSTYTTTGRIYSEQILSQLGFSPCMEWNDVENRFRQRQLAYMPLEVFCPALNQLFSYRSLLGVRSPANSMIKLVNPLQASLSLQSVFHPAYLELHQEAARLLGHQHSLVMKGEGGELEFRPDADNRIFILRQGTATIEKWSRVQAKREPDHTLEVLGAEYLRKVWSGEVMDPYGIEAINGTIAMILFAGGHAVSEAEARQMARNYWNQRNLKYLA